MPSCEKKIRIVHKIVSVLKNLYCWELRYEEKNFAKFIEEMIQNKMYTILSIMSICNFDTTLPAFLN